MKIFSIIVIALTYAKSEEDCNNPADNDNCDYYSECIEFNPNLPTCGENGYAIGYGYKYCRRYKENRPLFTNKVNEFLDQVRPCLISKMRKYLNDTLAGIITCEDIHDKAMEEHEFCYLRSGFCDLGIFEKFSLGKVVDLYDKINGGIAFFLKVWAQCIEK